jgi:hypothetical protein
MINMIRTLGHITRSIYLTAEFDLGNSKGADNRITNEQLKLGDINNQQKVDFKPSLHTGMKRK